MESWKKSRPSLSFHCYFDKFTLISMTRSLHSEKIKPFYPTFLSRLLLLCRLTKRADALTFKTWRQCSPNKAQLLVRYQHTFASRGKSIRPSHSIQRQSDQMHFLRKCQKRIHSNQTAKLLKFLFPHLNILCYYFICMTSLPAICPLPHQSPLCSPFNWLHSLLCGHLISSFFWFPILFSTAKGGPEADQLASL